MREKEVLAGRLMKETKGRVLELLNRTGSTDGRLLNCALMIALPVLEERLNTGKVLYQELCEQDCDLREEALPAVQRRRRRDDAQPN